MRINGQDNCKEKEKLPGPGGANVGQAFSLPINSFAAWKGCTTFGLFILLALNVAWGAERFPPPDFESGYTLPPTGKPTPEHDAWEYLDTFVLAAALSVAAYLALKKRSRRSIIVLTILSLLYFGLWRKGCVCSIGALQNVVLALTDGSYAVPMTVVAFFVLPLLFALFFGRVFCSSVCPLGAIQDLVLVKPVKLPGWLEEMLRPAAYIYLGLAVLLAATGSMFVICQYDPFVAFFRLSGGVNMLVLGACFLVLGVFVGRPYCRFLCPYGVLLGLASKVSKWHVRITPAECVQCRLCEESCPFGAIRKPMEQQTPHLRNDARRRLGCQLLALPLLIVAGVFLGGLVGPPLSRTHAIIRLAERIRIEDAGVVKGDTDASRAFRSSGRPTEGLLEEALDLRRRFITGGRLLGAYVGLVIGMKLIVLTVRRTRPDYEADRFTCVGCGRCFEYCPI